MAGKIYLIATPIGNLGDFAFRAVEVLKSVDLIACEDTRRTQILLNHYGISKKLFSLREHNENLAAEKIINEVGAGKTVAYLTDAGTPLISDPGLILLKKALAAGISIEAIPGPTAFLQALVLSGLNAEQFKFCGFLPAKKSERLRALHDVEDEKATLIFHEAPHRFLESLEDLEKILGDRRMAVARELTKKFEEIFRGKISEAITHFKTTKPRGEFTLVIEGSSVPEKTADFNSEKIVRKLLDLKIDEKKILLILKEIFHLPRNKAYQLMLKVKNSAII